MEISKKGHYYGEEKKVFEHGGFLLSEYDYLDKGTPWHYHENPYFMFVLSGNMLDVNKKKRTNCPQGSLLFHNWQDPHLNTRESPMPKDFILNLIGIGM